MESLKFLDGFSLNEEIQTEIIGCVKLQDDEEIHFDGDNVEIVSNVGEHFFCKLSNFKSDLNFLNGTQFLAKQNKLAIINFYD